MFCVTPPQHSPTAGYDIAQARSYPVTADRRSTVVQLVAVSDEEAARAADAVLRSEEEHGLVDAAEASTDALHPEEATATSLSS